MWGILALVVAAMAAVTLELAAYLLLVAFVTVAGRGSVAGTLVWVSVGGAYAWFVAGGVCYEVARRRAVVTVFALLPLALAAATALAGVTGRHGVSWARGLGALVFAGLLGVCAYGGGRLWERRIRRARALH
jgi:hypothetical protein